MAKTASFQCKHSLFLNVKQRVTGNNTLSITKKYLENTCREALSNNNYERVPFILTKATAPPNHAERRASID